MTRRVGYRFHPTDEELVDYFLRLKRNGVHFDDVIRDIDICKFEPWDLPTCAAQGSDDQVWYFFHRREKEYRSTSKPRYNRSTKTGHWKPTGKERPVKAKHTRRVIGTKRTLVFYRRGEPEKLRTNWVIHEYELKNFPHHQAEWVLCKLKEKVDGKTDNLARRAAESSHNEASDITIDPAEVAVSQPQCQIEEALSALQPQVQTEEGFSALQPQIHLEEGFSIDDLMLTDDIFQSGYNGLRNQFDTAELQQNPDEVDDSFFVVPNKFTGGQNLFTLPEDRVVKQMSMITRDPGGSDIEETASNASTHPNNSGSPQSSSGVYLDEMCNMDSNNAYVRSCREMGSIQTVTEILPPSIYEQSGNKKNQFNCDEILTTEASTADLVTDRHEKFNGIRKLSKEILTIMMALMHQPRTGKSTVQKKTTRPSRKFKIRNRIRIKLSGKFEPKAREAKKHDTDLDVPRYSLKESITIKTDKDQKMVTRKISLKSKTYEMISNDKACSSVHQEVSLLNKRTGNNTEERKTMRPSRIFRIRNQIHVKLPGISEAKAREARKYGNDLDLPRKSLKESIAMKTDTHRKIVSENTSLKSRTDGMISNDKTCSSGHLEASLLNQRTGTVEKKTTWPSRKFKIRNQIQAREARKHDTDLDVPHKSLKESIAPKTDTDQKRVTEKISSNSRTDGMTSNDKTALQFTQRHLI